MACLCQSKLRRSLYSLSVVAISYLATQNNFARGLARAPFFAPSSKEDRGSGGLSCCRTMVLFFFFGYTAAAGQHHSFFLVWLSVKRTRLTKPNWSPNPFFKCLMLPPWHCCIAIVVYIKKHNSPPFLILGNYKRDMEHELLQWVYFDSHTFKITHDNTSTFESVTNFFQKTKMSQNAFKIA